MSPGSRIFGPATGRRSDEHELLGSVIGAVLPPDLFGWRPVLGGDGRLRCSRDWLRLSSDTASVDELQFVGIRRQTGFMARDRGSASLLV
jgi:hypothetical protein